MEIIVERKLSDEELKYLKGKYVNNSHIHYPVVTEDCDCYTDCGALLFKFRSGVANREVADRAFNAFKNLAPISRGRGASAGPINTSGIYWSKRTPLKTSGYSTQYETPEGKESKMRVNNPVFGGLVGYYEPSKSFGDLPCRLTSFTINHMNEYIEGCHYARNIARSYEELCPEQYKDQVDRSDKLPHLKIEDTPFSTITVNRNFQTAVHKDSGDYGFGNLSVLERGHYHGGYFVIPKYGIAVDMRHGDHLCVDVHQFHANTELYETDEDKEKNKDIVDIFNDNLEIGVMGQGKKFTRISLVLYLRENLYKKCPNALVDPQMLHRISYNKHQVNFKYVINLEKDEDRFKKFKYSDWKVFPATHFNDMSPDDPLFKKMISYWNIRDTDQHRAKCGCFQSHLSLLKWIVIHQLDNVLICEDDAVQLRDIVKKFPKDGITYLGGFIMNKKITSKEKILINHKQGINELDKDKYRMMMALAYIIPHWKMAESIVDRIESKDRVRAWDVELSNCSPKIYYEYPAIFKEEKGIVSTIRGKKQKHGGELYERV